MNSTQEITQELVNEVVGAAHGDYERVKELVTQYPALATANASWVETPIEAAAQMGRRDIVEFLLNAGAPLDICTAAMLGDVERVEAFLREDPGLKDAKGAHGIPVMYYPAIIGNTVIAEILLEHGADINAGEGGNTALHGAAMFGQAIMAEWLLAHGANPDALDYEGKTPLEVAIKNGHSEVAEVLRRESK